jgi:hypothetical protein
MKPLLLLCAFCSMVACSTAPLPSKERSRPSIAESDRLLVLNFLRALYRPGASDLRIVADPNAEESWQSIPLRQRRAELKSRLATLRSAPKDVLRIVIHSGDDPKHPTWLAADFTRSSGRFEVIPLSTYPNRDLSIDVRHWPDGTRLVCVSCAWIGDMKDDIFHRHSGERIYRFAISSLPLM